MKIFETPFEHEAARRDLVEIMFDFDRAWDPYSYDFGYGMDSEWMAKYEAYEALRLCRYGRRYYDIVTGMVRHYNEVLEDATRYEDREAVKAVQDILSAIRDHLPETAPEI